MRCSLLAPVGLTWRGRVPIPPWRLAKPLVCWSTVCLLMFGDYAPSFFFFFGTKYWSYLMDFVCVLNLRSWFRFVAFDLMKHFTVCWRYQKAEALKKQGVGAVLLVIPEVPGAPWNDPVQATRGSMVLEKWSAELNHFKSFVCLVCLGFWRELRSKMTCEQVMPLYSGSAVRTRWCVREKKTAQGPNSQQDEGLMEHPERPSWRANDLIRLFERPHSVKVYTSDSLPSGLAVSKPDREERVGYLSIWTFGEHADAVNQISCFGSCLTSYGIFT